MDSGFATISSQLSTSEMPTEFYSALFNIAVRGYGVKDVIMWYEAILENVRRMNADNAQSSYNGFALPIETPNDAQYPNFLETDCAARRATLATIDSCVSPTTKMAAIPSTEISRMDSDVAHIGPPYHVHSQDSMSQAYNTPQSQAYQTYTSTHPDTTPEPSHNQPMLPTWSPAPSSAAETDMYALNSASMSNSDLVAFAGEPDTAVPPTYPWFSTHEVGVVHTRTQSQQSHLSQHSLPNSSQQMPQLPPQHHQPQQPYLAPDYSAQQMPALVPFASGTSGKAAMIPTATGTGAASLYTSSAGNYFPIIHVSSSRRRRKALQKGVKKMVQPLKARRQQSV